MDIWERIKNALTVFSLSTKDMLVIFAETVFSFLAFSGERVEIIVKIKALGKTENEVKLKKYM